MMNSDDFMTHDEFEKYINALYPQTNNIRTIEQISRAEFILFHWADVTQFKDQEPMYIQGARRSVHEAARAAANYDIYMKAKNDHDTN